MQEFCGLAVCTALDDATVNSLIWIWAKYHRPVGLPDTTGLSWRGGIIRCLESVQSRSRTSPPSSPSAIPLLSLSDSTADSSLPPSVAKSSLPFAAHSSPRPWGSQARRPQRSQVYRSRLTQARHPWGSQGRRPQRSQALHLRGNQGRRPRLTQAQRPLHCQARRLQPQSSWICCYPRSSRLLSSYQSLLQDTLLRLLSLLRLRWSRSTPHRLLSLLRLRWSRSAPHCLLSLLRLLW